MIFFFFFCVLFHALTASADEIGVGSDGSVTAFTVSDERHVEVTNGCNESISLFWGSSADEEAHMFDMEPDEISVLVTLNGHSFFATEFAEKKNVITAFSIQNGVDSVIVNPRKEGYGSAEYNKRYHDLGSPVKIMGMKSKSLTAKFRCLCPALDYYYDDGKEGVFSGSIVLGTEVSTNTYEGHVFYFTEKGKKSNVIARLTMTNKQVRSTYEIQTKKNGFNPFLHSKSQALYLIQDPNNPPPASYLELAAKEEIFRNDYFNRTGLVWRHYFGPNGPRPPPIYHMWPVPAVGHKHHVTSSHGFWNCGGRSETCHSKEPVNIELVVASVTPRVLLIPSFLSDFECEEIINLARPHTHASKVGDPNLNGASVSSTRTSKNSWIPRSKNAITETLSLRAADLMQIDEKLLHMDKLSEDLQVVHYTMGQKYDPHNDWGGAGRAESRFLTLLIYLNDMDGPDAGGETAFPKGADLQGFKVTPRKGSAVLFYNLLDDGNGDDLALHAAQPVTRGEKWAANFWVWDPKRNSDKK